VGKVNSFQSLRNSVCRTTADQTIDLTLAVRRKADWPQEHVGVVSLWWVPSVIIVEHSPYVVVHSVAHEPVQLVSVELAHLTRDTIFPRQAILDITKLLIAQS
jgi:hypothetical protein